MNDVNELFEKAKQEGFLYVYYDTPEEVSKKVKDYNNEMGECRVNRKKMFDLEKLFRFINPVLSILTFVFSLLGDDSNIAFISLMILLFLTLYFVFTMVKKNFYVVSIAAAVLMTVNMLNIVLVIVDLLIAIYCVKIDSELKMHDGYIAFNDIRLIPAKENMPTE